MLAHKDFKTPMVSVLTVYTLGILFCYVYVVVFGLDLIGVAMARNTTDFLCFIVLLVLVN